MIKNYEDILSKVVFDNYSSSSVWRGYLNVDSTELYVPDQLVSSFITKVYSPNLLLAFDYNIFWDFKTILDAFEGSEEALDRVLSPLVAAGIVNLCGGDLLSSMTSISCCPKKLKLLMHPSKAIIENLLLLVFRYVGLSGHVLFYLPSEEAILYAHDDNMGFGVFSNDQKKTSAMEKMLADNRNYLWMDG